MDKLFDDTYLVENKRPTEITPQQKNELFLILAKEAVKKQFSSDSLENIADDFSHLSMNDTGFEMAKQLDDAYSSEFTYDGEFIDFLDTFSHRRDQILQENTRLWIKAHNIQPKYAIDTSLKIVESFNRNLKKDTVLYITNIRGSDGTYVVSIDKGAQGGYIIAYERVESNCEMI
jgi:hypothetical protein